ncbi:MAG: response regulator transcription factor [Bacteroidota bacterium]
MDDNYKILLVDDEPDIIEFISYNLIKEGYSVLKASNGSEALQIAQDELPHLIILDVMMPGMDGMETCEALRKIPALNNTVIAFLTARGEDYSQIAGFDAGADDYITKPVKPKVLVSRVKALLKRFSLPETSDTGTKPTGVTGLVIDKERYLVIHKGNELSLPRKEFELLALLHSKPERVFTRDEIYDTIWGDEVIVGDRTIDVHIRKLREKIGDECIQTIKGVGYKFVCE